MFFDKNHKKKDKFLIGAKKFFGCHIYLLSEIR